LRLKGLVVVVVVDTAKQCKLLHTSQAVSNVHIKTALFTENECSLFYRDNGMAKIKACKCFNAKKNW
jgi:hypothetical protein